MERPNILSIDDEPSFTDLLKQYFEPRGYGIDVTSSGDKGLELMSRKKYDVVLLDLKMAGLGGDDVMAEIKSMDSKAKIIFITAYSDSGKTKDRVMSNGAFAYVEKPITSLKHLENLVNEAAKAEKQEE
jgi:DNA-binding NtrC family response regulator